MPVLLWTNRASGLDDTSRQRLPVSPHLMQAETDLATEFQKFAAYVYARGTGTAQAGPAGSNLCDDMWSKWLSGFLDPPVNNLCPFKTALASRTIDGLTQMIRDNSASVDPVYVYLGLYHFAVLYLSSYRVSGTRLHDKIRDAVGDAIFDTSDGWKCSVGSPSEITVTLKPDAVASAPLRTGSSPNYTYNDLFQGLFHPSKSFNEQLSERYQKLGNYLVRTDGRSKLEYTQKLEATASLVRTVRNDVDYLLNAEINDLLAGIGGDLNDKYHRFRVYGTGNGSTTNSFFATDNLGLIFLKYDTQYIAPDGQIHGGYEDIADYIKPQNPITIRPVFDNAAPGGNGTEFGSAAQRTFLAFLGNNSATDLGLKIGAPAGPGTPLQLKMNILNNAKQDGYFKLDGSVPSWLSYDGSAHTLSRTGPDSSVLRVDAVTTGDDDEEWILFVLDTDAQLAQRLIKLGVSYIFLNNEFLVPASAWQTFWTSDLASLKSLIHLVGATPAVDTTSCLSGDGVGRHADTSDNAPLGSDVVRAQSQDDNEVPDTLAPDNNFIRYACAELTISEVQNAPQNRFDLTTLGFVSALRCTWDGWPEFDAPTLAAMNAQYGQWMRKDAQNRPIYNSVLSAFRAVGLAYAIKKRLESYASALAANGDITNAECDAVQAALDGQMSNARAYILQPNGSYATKPPAGGIGPPETLYVDLAAFLQFARAKQDQ